jgi:hypothetical protein
MNLVCFYHVWQIPGWELLYQQQIMALYTSGLYDKLDNIYVCCNGQEKLPFETSKIILRFNNNYENENDTLYTMWQLSNINKNLKILYIHTKGISYQFHPSRKNVDGWRLYMEFYNIHKWKDCVEKLDTYDIVGTEWVIAPTNYVNEKEQIFLFKNAGFYLGSFWWATSKYISSLDKNYLFNYKAAHEIEDYDIETKFNPSDNDKKNILRHNSELWLGTNSPKYYNFRNLNELELSIFKLQDGSSRYESKNKKYNVGYDTNALTNLESFI